MKYGTPDLSVEEQQLKNKLQIGCGWNKLDGFINIDKTIEVMPDEVVNIEDGLPFDDNTFDYIYSSHCLEHVSPAKFRYVLEEIGRVAKNGCILELDLPFDNQARRTNFDHYRTFSFSSFDEITEGYGKDKRFYYYPFTLVRLNKKPGKIFRIFCQLFPFFMDNINFKFKVVKR